jgi:hypothetical protein
LIHASGVATEEGDRVDALTRLVLSDDFRGGHSHLSADGADWRIDGLA